jgi:hypothetical protein
MQKFKKEFIKGIQERIETEKDSISQGSLEIGREYGLACGRVQGMKDTLRIFEDLWEELIQKGKDSADAEFEAL